MLFSILIANYNNSRYLQTAIESVLKQDCTDWEIILVDDASTDNFEIIIEPHRNNNRIRIYKNPKNMGCGFTKRACVEKASGDIIGFLDPDDALVPNAISLMVEAHRCHPNYSLISSTHFICDELLQVKRVAEYPRALPNMPYLLLNDGSVHAFASFKAKNYQQTEGLSAKNKKAVDQDLYYKLEDTGPIAFIPKPLYYYRIHARGISNGGQEQEAMISHFNIVEEACLRRMAQLKVSKPLDRIKFNQYNVRYHKIKVLNNFRKRKWAGLAWHLFLFSLVGGRKNLASYLSKLPRQGFALLRRSFFDTYKIE